MYFARRVIRRLERQDRDDALGLAHLPPRRAVMGDLQEQLLNKLIDARCGRTRDDNANEARISLPALMTSIRQRGCAGRSTPAVESIIESMASTNGIASPQ